MLENLTVSETNLLEGTITDQHLAEAPASRADADRAEKPDETTGFWGRCGG